MKQQDSTSIPSLCDALQAEFEDFIDDWHKVAGPEAAGRLFSDGGRSLRRRAQRMGSLIRMIREKGSEETR